VNDTPVEVARKYREMLLRRPGADRLKMGCSMFATARALVVASLLEREPSASPAALRQGVFLRFYGADFAPDERERIMAWLGRVDPGPSGSPRRVPVNWDDLEMALTANPDEWRCYFDVRSGEVQMTLADRFGADDEWPSEEEIDAGLAAGYLIPVEPLGSAVEYGWMAEFTETVRNARLRDLLEVALDGRGAFRRFKTVLNDYPGERQRWFTFRDTRLREAASEWLTEHGIEPTTRPRRA
jgi:hypothetical protein